MPDLSIFPKTVKLNNDRVVSLQVLEESDEERLYQFMTSLPAEERVYYRDDVTDRNVISKWAKNRDFHSVFPLVAMEDEKIVANWSMHMHEHGWTRHLANLRGIVHPDIRGGGLAIQMVYELLGIASQYEIEGVVVELVAPQKSVLAHFNGLGFEVQAVLKDWVKDFDGRYHNKLILSAKLEPAWKKMEEMILDYGTHGG